MVQLAIIGHPTRGKEVIEILEMLGGKNHFYDGTFKELIYTIGSELELDVFNINFPGVKDGYIVFTLEEFLEKFPYKVGDKVLTRGSAGKITDMKWQGDSFFTTKEGGEVVYTVMLDTKEEITFSVEDLQPHKEETMEKNNNWAKWDLPDGYEFQDEEGNVIKSGVIRLVKKQSQYPKTYKECCDVLNIPNDERYIDIDVPLDYNKLLSVFTELIICRKAYWKIAGEEMGLGKPWEPDWNNDDETKFCIYTTQNIISLDLFGVDNRILAFPTEEMRDAFYENFKDLIEVCKKLL